MVNPSHAAILEMCAHAPVEEHPAGATLMKQGEIGTFCLVILGGEVDIFVRSSEGTPRKVATRGVGDLVGELSLFEKIRTATVIVSAPVRCARIPHAALLQMLNNRPSVAVTFLAAAMEKARELVAGSPFRDAT